MASPSPWKKYKSTWLVQIGTTHLKDYPVVTAAINWIWRHGYPIYVAISLSNRTAKRWRKLTKLSEFAKNKGVPTYKLADACSVETPSPRVYPVCDNNYLASPSGRYEFPGINVSVISNATIFARTNLILTDGEVVCHDLFDFERDYTSEELHGFAVINPKAESIRWLRYDEEPKRISAAAAFVDACAINYAHWLTEVLPRVLLFCSEEKFKGIPIVVDDGLHENIMESLSLVVGPEREVIRLPLGRSLCAEALYVTSATGYVPFGRRTNKLSGHSHGVFSSHALGCLRKHFLPLAKKIEEVAWPEKVLIRRNSGARNVSNFADLEMQLVARGYVVVEPEKMTFSEQIRLFNNAQKIISATGSALTNAIFCKPGAQVAVLMGKHEEMIYRYWINLLGPLGVKVSYILGDITRNGGQGIHGDFSVGSSCIRDLLKDFDK